VDLSDQSPAQTNKHQVTDFQLKLTILQTQNQQKKLTCTGVKAKLDVSPDVAPPLLYCLSLNLKISNQACST